MNETQRTHHIPNSVLSYVHSVNLLILSIRLVVFTILINKDEKIDAESGEITSSKETLVALESEPRCLYSPSSLTLCWPPEFLPKMQK